MATHHIRKEKDMTDKQKLDLILDKVVSLDEKVDSLDKKVDSLGKKVDSLDKKVDSLDKKVDSLDKKVDSLDKKVDSLDKKVDSLDKEVKTLKADMKDVKMEITGIHLTLENEIRVNIVRVAEGHLDLSRKLDEYISLSHKIKDKQEINDIYINMHTNKLRALSSSL